MTTTNEMTRSQMIGVLKKGACKAKFRAKGTGKIETMNCTLDTDIIPETVEGKIGGENKDVITVWNTDKKAWRSMRTDFITDIQIL